MNNKFLHLKVIFLLLSILIIAPIHSFGIVVFINHGVFKNTENSSFTEVYLKVPVSSIEISKTAKNTYKASILVKLEYSQKDSIYFSGEYNIESPELNDTSNLNFALTDLIRVILPYGTFNLQVWISDNNNIENKTYYASILNTRFKNSMISFSDIMFSDTVYASQTQNVFTRSTYNVIPNVFNSYSSVKEKLFFYLEFYNADKFIKEENLFVTYYLRLDSMDLADFQHTTRLKVASTNYLIGSLLIRDLPIGNYELIAEVYNSKNVRLSSKTAFFSKQKNSNVVVEDTEIDSKLLLAQIIKGYSTDQLLEYMDYLYVLSSHDELQETALLKRSKDADELAEYFFAFWLKRDQANPAKAWINYLNRIEECNKLFGTQLRKGYLTDRGRVFMEYGAPNSVLESDNAMLAYPYQIWHYYQLSDFQHNKKFIFFNRTGTMDEYELIHSDASGEVRNEEWKKLIGKYNNLNPTDEDVFGDYLDDDFGQ